MPLIYYHVWDNFPAPHYNSRYYESTDKVVCISKVTHQILQEVSPTVDSCYLPHAVDSDVFRKYKKTDEAYENPAFTEDACRIVSKELDDWLDRKIKDYKLKA